MVARWLGLGSFTAVAQVQFLIAELRSRKLGSVATHAHTYRHMRSCYVALPHPYP